jgi:hypothetical protein
MAEKSRTPGVESKLRQHIEAANRLDLVRVTVYPATDEACAPAERLAGQRG